MFVWNDVSHQLIYKWNIWDMQWKTTNTYLDSLFNYVDEACKGFIQYILRGSSVSVGGIQLTKPKVRTYVSEEESGLVVLIFYKEIFVLNWMFVNFVRRLNEGQINNL